MATSRTFLWLVVIIACSTAIASVNARPQEREAEELGSEDRRLKAAIKFTKMGVKGAKLAAKYFKKGWKKLGELTDNYYENEAMICNWNDWRTRDARARKTRTYKTCRFSQQKRVLWWVTGTWYCTLTPEACQVRGHRLD